MDTQNENPEKVFNHLSPGLRALLYGNSHEEVETTIDGDMRKVPIKITGFENVPKPTELAPEPEPEIKKIEAEAEVEPEIVESKIEKIDDELVPTRLEFIEYFSAYLKRIREGKEKYSATLESLGTDKQMPLPAKSEYLVEAGQKYAELLKSKIGKMRSEGSDSSDIAIFIENEKKTNRRGISVSIFCN